MRKSRVLIVLCAVAIAATLLLTGHAPPDPVVKGRTLSHWLTSADYDENRAQVSQAVLSAGKQGLPLLHTWLRSGNRLQRTLIRHGPIWLWNRWPVKKWRKQFTLKERAMSALETLGESGREATADLLGILQDSTEDTAIRQRAMQTLFAVRADSSLVIPVLNKLAHDSALGRSAAASIKYYQTGTFWADRPVQNLSLFKKVDRGPHPPPNENFKPENFTLLHESQSPDPADLRRKAEAGDAEAQARLSTLLHEGKPGFPKQDVEAYKWAAIAASHENTTAKHLLRELELFMQPKDIAEGKSAADALISGPGANAR